MSDEIRAILKELPLQGFEESQIGNHIYAGRGEMKVGGQYLPTCVRIRLVHGTPRVYVRIPRAGIFIACPLDVEKAGGMINRAIRQSLN